VRFGIPHALLAELHAWRSKRAVHDEVETKHEAFCLDGGIGPGWYLTSDGVVLRDGSAWDDEPLREATDAEAWQAIVIGAKKTGVVRLLDLLPARPAGACPCSCCHGDRYVAVAAVHEESLRIVCRGCNGLGWTVALIDS
jgi:hypothetical protein